MYNRFSIHNKEVDVAFLMLLLTGAIIFVACVACMVMASKRGSETNIRIALSVAAIAVVMVWVWYFNWNSSPQREQEQAANDCGDTTMAFVMSQNFVKQRLKAPNSASFPTVVDKGVSVRAIPDCSFDVSAYVDAQNAFGAPIRNSYTAKMSYDRANKLWRATQLIIE
ncbi:hypothetical protein ACQR3P_18545 [Rhodococcus sp. IEGM1300]